MNGISTRFSAPCKRAGAIAALLACVAAPLLASEPPYLPTGQPDAVGLLAPPPAPNSPEQNADLASTIAVWGNRTPQDEALGRAERKFTLLNFAPAIGPAFQPGRLPLTEALFQEVESETAAVTDTAKDFWKRPRPFLVEPKLAAAGGPMEKSFSYPSGHSTRATVFALLLADLFPERAAEILAVGRDIGWHRVELGRHYPTDIYAGRTLAKAIVRELRASPGFQRDFAKVKTEVALAESAAAGQATAALPEPAPAPGYSR